MEEQDKWVFYKDIDWDCLKNNRFNIDTRDFHCGYRLDKETHKNINILLKHKDRFVCTKEEIIKILDRLFNESGGKGEWRCLILESKDDIYKNWNLKYLRIHRIADNEFIICNSEEKALNKNVLLNSKVNEKLLGHH